MALTQIKGEGLVSTYAIGSEGGAVTTSVQQGVAKVWVNLDGTGTIAVSDSLNVTSATDVGTGEYTITIANDMSNSTYSISGGTNPGGGAYTVLGYSTLATGSYKMFTSDGGSSQEDKDPVMSNLHGDLA